MSLIRKKSVRKAISTVTGLTMVVWMCGIGMLAPMMGVVVADDRPSVTVDGVTVYDGDLISSNATNPDGTPTYESLDIYISKVVSDTETYKRLVLNPSVFNSYGHLVWGDVAEVSPTVMAGFTTSDLARQDGTDEVYSLVADDDTGTKHWVNLTATQFVDEAGADADSIYTINSTDNGSYTTGGAYTVVQDFIDRTPPVAVTGDLTVALASDTAAAATLATGSAYNPVLKFNFTAGSGGDATITGLAITKSGLVANSTITGIGVFDADGNRYGNFASSLTADNIANIGFASNPIVIPAGQTVPVLIKINVLAGALTGTASFSLASADAVTTTSGVSGSFPVTGNTFSFVNGSSSIASMTFDIQALGDSSVDINAVDHQATRFRISESSGNENLELARVILYNNGNAADADFKDVGLYSQDGTLLATAQPSGKYVDFKLDTRYLVPTGTSRDFTVKLTAVDGSGQNIKLAVQESYDIEAYGALTGSGILSSTSYPTSTDQVTINSGDVTFTKSGTSPSGKVAIGGKDVVLAEYDIRPSGENFEFRSFYYSIKNVTTDLVGTVKFQVDGVTVYSIAAASAKYKTTVPGTTASNYANPTLTSYQTLESNTTYKLRVVADISSSALTSDNYTVYIGALYGKRMSTNDFVTKPAVITTTAGQASNNLSVDVSALSLSENQNFSDPTIVAGGSNQKIGSFHMGAGSAEGVRVTSMKVTLSSVTSYQNVTLKEGSTILGTPISNPTGTTGNAVSISPALDIPASGYKVIDVYADTTSGAGTTTVTLGTIVGTGIDSASTVTSPSDTAGQTVAVSTGGTLTVSLDTTNTPVAGIAHSGEVDRSLMAATFAANNAEDIKVTVIQVTATNGTASLKDLKLMVGGVQKGVTAQLINGVASFTDTTDGLFTITKDDSVTLYVEGSTTNTGAINSKAVTSVGIDYIEGIGASGGSPIKPGTTLSTTWSGTDTDTAGVSITVADTTGFHIGDVVFAYSTHATASSLGVVTAEPTTTTAMFVATRSAVVKTASATISKIASGATTAAESGTAIKAGADITVTSSKGFTVGDPVIVANGSATELGWVQAITDSVTMNIRTLTDMSADATRVSKIGTDTRSTGITAVTALTTTTAPIATTVTSSTGFQIGDFVLLQDISANGTFGVVTAINSNGTGITLAVGANLTPSSATAATLVRVGSANPSTTFVTTAATAFARVITATAATVSDTTGFGAADIVVTAAGSTPQNVSVILGKIGAVTTSTSMTIGAAVADTTAAATIVTRLPGAVSSSREVTLYDVEPVITASATPIGGSSTAQSDQEVAKFDILADGDRNLSVTSLNVQANGNNLPWNNVTAYDLYRGATKLSSATPQNYSTAAAASANDLTGATLYLCWDTNNTGTTNDGVVYMGAEASGTNDRATFQKKLALNDTIVLFDDTTNYITAKVTAVSTAASGAGNCNDGTTDNDLTLTVSNSSTTGTTTAGDTVTKIKSFNVIFDANSATPLSAQTVTSGSSTAFTVKADTTSVKTDSTAGTAVSYNVKISGTQGSTGGLTWGFTPSGTSIAITGLTSSDSYPVNGPTFTY